MKDLIVDCFAGGGGASVGIEMALRKQIPEKPIFLHNRSDTCSLWECPQCKRRFATTRNMNMTVTVL